jgi:hypothetical protein
LRRSCRHPTAKNQKKAEQKVRDQGAAGSVHDVLQVRIEGRADANIRDGNVKAGTERRLGPRYSRAFQMLASKRWLVAVGRKYRGLVREGPRMTFSGFRILRVAPSRALD